MIRTGIITLLFSLCLSSTLPAVEVPLRQGGGGRAAETLTADDVEALADVLSERREVRLPAAPAHLHEPVAGDAGKNRVVTHEDGTIDLVAEPSDTMIDLRWHLPHSVAKALRDVSYTVFYGMEPGKFSRKVDVGAATSFRLRDLQNGRTYYVMIKGMPKDGSVNLLSKEVVAVPDSADRRSSPLEKSFARTTVTLQDRTAAEPLERNLKQFGYDFFRHPASTTPADALPVGPDYVIGPGDTIRIDIWGSINARHDLTVDRNGEIVIPKAGSVRVWGLTYAQAKEAINRAVSRYFRGYEMNVTLGTLRSIQVFLVGEVQVPGPYTVSSLSTPLTVLTAAGGPTKNGSLRRIRVIRQGKLVRELDLYDFFISGDRSGDVRLENGDSVVVPVLGAVAAVAGEVRRPAIYELKETTTLKGLLELAGGVTAVGDGGRIQVERVEGNRSRVVLDHENKVGKLADDAAGTEIRDHDMVKIFAVERSLRQVVTLVGHVSRPGDYQFRPGMRLRDLIPSYAAILPEPYTESAVLTRLVPPDLHRETVSVNLGKMLDGDDRENIPLMEQDRVEVFSLDQMAEKKTVTISGYVVRPDTYPYFQNMTVRDLLSAAGSVRRNAYLDNAELSRVSSEEGKAVSVQLSINLAKALAGDPAQNIRLQPDDILIVRSVPDWLEATDKYVTVKGEVRFPGTYAVSKGEKMSSVIERAGGFTEKAYLKGAKFTRKSVQETQQKRLEEVVARTEEEIVKRQGELASLAASKEELEATKTALDALLKDLDRLKKVKAEGRVVIQLTSLPEFKKSDYDLEVFGGDVLDIPQESSVVVVMGEVFNPTSLIHRHGKPLSYYLKKAGGATRNAEEDDMYVIKADGSLVSRHDSGFGLSWDNEGRRWSFGGFMSAVLEPGDTVVVPQKLDRTAWMRDIKDITTILSQVAVTAGVVFAAGL